MKDNFSKRETDVSCKSEDRNYLAKGIPHTVNTDSPGIRSKAFKMSSEGLRLLVDCNNGGLKGSTQHWLAVDPPEFQIPMFFEAVF
ncbi:MAG TPA: hypothetical protein VN843_19985, partial [Anaerolineales bacterium]|nr:hypothetical protein [Anaerolineales bacterium]